MRFTAILDFACARQRLTLPRAYAKGERRPNSLAARPREALLSGEKFPYAPRWLGLGAAAAALAIDQAHKYWMLKVFDIDQRQPIRLTPFLDVMLSWNHGVSYSLFSVHDDMARSSLLGAQLLIVGGLFFWLWRSRARIVALGLGLIIGGALGNVTDRWLRGAVADFFFLHTSLPVGPLANYVFNLADVAITIGVALLLLENLVVPAPPSDAPAR
jgi:signal peptidase II